MISSIGTPTSSFGRGCRATPMDQLLVMANSMRESRVGRKLSSTNALPPGVDHFPDTLWRERQLVRLDPESAERIRDRIRNNTAGRDDPAFAGAFGAERVDRGREHVSYDRAQVGEIARGGQHVVGERAGQQL